MSIEVEGIFLSQDFTDYITEKFAKRFCVDTKQWIQPFAYYDEANDSLISNGYVPDGTYALIGSVSYPGIERWSSHTVFQFNLLKIRGEDIVFAKRMNLYPDLPPEIPLKPVFPIFRLGDHTQFREASKVFKDIGASHLTCQALTDKIVKLEDNSLESKIYRIRLAVQRRIEKEQYL